MGKVSVNALKNYFRTGARPTQDQFWDVFDSFRHKDDKVSTSDVEGLDLLFNQIQSWVENEIEAMVTGSTNLGSITPLSIIPPTINVHGFAVEDGTYTNCGGIVVPANSFAFISRVDGVWGISKTEFDLSIYAKISDLDQYSKTIDQNTKISEIHKSLNLINEFGEEIPEKTIKINPEITVYAGNTLESRTKSTWYVGISKKNINFIEVPIVRRMQDNLAFTDGIILRIAINGVFIFNHEITLAEITSGGFNSLTSASTHESFRYQVQVPEFKVVSGDIIYIGMMCKSVTDKMGFASVNTAANEWNPLKIYYGTADINNYSVAPASSLANNTGYSIPINFGYNDFIKNKIKDLIPNVSTFIETSDITRLERGTLPITGNRLRIQPLGVTVYAAGTLDNKTNETWYKGLTNKILNTISIPIVRPWYSSLVFTSGITVRVALNGKFILTRIITLSEINAGGFNSTNGSTPVDAFFFNLQIPLIEIKLGDEIYIGIKCEGTTDKIGFTYTTDNTGEWGDRWYKRSTNDISAYTSVPVKSGSNDYSLAVKFGYNDYTQEKIKGRLNTESVISINSRNINSFIGGVNTVIDALIAVKPKARFVFLTHFTEDGILGNRSCENLIKAQIALAEYWGTDILVLSKKLNWIKKNGKNTLIANVPDELHPGTDGTLESVQKIKRYVKQFLTPMFDSWSGKKIAWYGTSIPYGHPVNETSARYPDLAVNELGGICLNKSWPGSVIRRNKFDGTSMSLSFLDTSAPKNYQQDMLNLIGTSNEPDLFVFDFGINDWTQDPSDFEFDNRI